MKDERLELRLPHQTKARWQVLADERGVSLSQLVLVAVEAHWFGKTPGVVGVALNASREDQ